MQSLKHEDLIRVTGTLWAIWYARRKAIHEDIYQSPLSTHNFITSFVANLQLVQLKVKDRPAVQRSNTRWIPTLEGLMKINVDVALAKNSGIVVATAVARDFAGRFLGASVVVMEGSLEPETVEAISCKEGLALASDLLLQDFRVACDNAGVVASIREGIMGFYGHVV